MVVGADRIMSKHIEAFQYIYITLPSLVGLCLDHTYFQSDSSLILM